MGVRLFLLLLCVSAVAQAAPPSGETPAAPTPPSNAPYYSESAVPHAGCCNACMHSAHYCGWRFYELFHPPGDMHPRYEYQPMYGDYYYFRPYNYSVALEQQEIAEQLGDSAANPYGNRLFPALYREFEQRAKQQVDEELPPMPPTLLPSPPLSQPR